MPTYNLVTDLNATPDGMTPCSDAIAAIDGMSGNVTIIVPNGSFYLPGKTHTIDGPDSLTVETADGADAAFVAPADFEGVLLNIQVPLIWRDIDLRRSAGGAGPQIRLTTREETLIEDMVVTGRDDSGATDGGLFVPRARTPYAVITFRNVRSDEGCAWSSPSPDGRAFARITEENVGHVAFESCRVAEYSSHGIDGRESQGPITVDGGRYANCDGAQILSGQESSDISGVDVVIDPATSGMDTADYSEMAGIRLDPAHSSTAGPVTISDTHVRVATQGGGTVTAGIEAAAAAWGTTVEDSRVSVDGDAITAVHVAAADGSVGSPSRVRLQNSVFSGSATAGTAVDIAGRPDSVIVDCCIETPGVRQGLLVPSPVDVIRTDLAERCWL